MGNLLTSILNAGNSLQAFGQALNVTTNNVGNSQTAGYARQTATFLALPFDPSTGYPGGVMAGPVQSSRNALAEQAVRQQQTSLGFSQQKALDLGVVEPLFDPSSQTGISASLNNFFSSFSALSINPNDATARQTVLTAATQLAQAFQTAANGLANQQTSVNSEIQGSLAQINQLAAQIAQLNGQRQSSGGQGADAGVDASMYSALEQLSQFGGVTALEQSDGSVSVYLNGQTPLVFGNQSFALQGDFSAPQARILDSQGQDVTATVTAGTLGAELDTRNNTLPSYLASLNSLAQNLADQVNTTLSQGVDVNGSAPVNNLFTYGSSATAAQTISVNPLITPDQIAAALPSAPGGNGNALALSALANAVGANGSTFTQTYAALGAQVGQDVSTATANETTGQQLVTQAQSIRSQLSGVSLDQEAANLIQYQRSYQAASQMISVINSMTATLLNMLSS
jgi:flagellar hook-associated protein 1 FlgK